MADGFEKSCYFPTLSQSSSKWKNKCFDLLNNIEKDKSDVDFEGNTMDLKKSKEESEASLRKIQDEISTLAKQLKELDLEIEKPSKKYELELYELITKLTWDLESPENHLKGFVLGKILRVFDLDTTKYSQQEIADHLWKLIDPEP